VTRRLVAVLVPRAGADGFLTKEQAPERLLCGSALDRVQVVDHEQRPLTAPGIEAPSDVLDRVPRPRQGTQRASQRGLEVTAEGDGLSIPGFRSIPGDGKTSSRREGRGEGALTRSRGGHDQAEPVGPDLHQPRFQTLAPQRVGSGSPDLGGYHGPLRYRRRRQHWRVSSQRPAPTAHAYPGAGSGMGFLICGPFSSSLERSDTRTIQTSRPSLCCP